jgi:hypothetical protein
LALGDAEVFFQYRDIGGKWRALGFATLRTMANLYGLQLTVQLVFHAATQTFDVSHQYSPKKKAL